MELSKRLTRIQKTLALCDLQYSGFAINKELAALCGLTIKEVERSNDFDFDNLLCGFGNIFDGDKRCNIHGSWTAAQSELVLAGLSANGKLKRLSDVIPDKEMRLNLVQLYTHQDTDTWYMAKLLLRTLYINHINNKKNYSQ